jgi:hypothetical protein
LRRTPTSPARAGALPALGLLLALACGDGGVNAGTKDAAPDDAHLAGKRIVFVVGDSNGTVSPGEGIGDRFVRARLEGQGHAITVVPDVTAEEMLVPLANQADLVLVSESVLSMNLLAKLKPVTTPILNYEAFIQDDLGLTPPGPPGDPGLPDQFALGVKDSDTRIDIVAPNHPLAAGLEGTVAVYKEAKELTWGKVAATAEVIATLPGDPTGATIYVYKKGALLQDGTAAAGLRIGFFLEDDNVTGTPNLMTEQGLTLFDAAVRYATSGGAP